LFSLFILLLFGFYFFSTAFFRIIGQVFDKNPSLFIQLDIPSPPRAYTPPEEYPKYSEVAKNRIREILGVAHVPEERIKLRFS